MFTCPKCKKATVLERKLINPIPRPTHGGNEYDYICTNHACSMYYRDRQTFTSQGGIPSQAANQRNTGTISSGAARAAAFASIARPIKPTTPQRERTSIEKVAPEFGEITAWRFWKAMPGNEIGKGYMLFSATAQYMWTKEVNETAIIYDIDNLGWNYEVSGFWCYKTQFDCAYRMGEYKADVLGSIEIWGTIIEHEQGYRAQYAKIKSLDYSRTLSEDQMQQLRITYRVQVE